MSKLKRAIKSIIDEDKVSLRIYRDHAISGNYKGFRELHVESDLLLIYYFSNNRLELLLLDTGSHDELFKWFY
ncbi:type II toxin-antitoxin system YafQ family toxin [Pediococcus argentinicus]|uniref:type II toxin-antitoxin system YafQ family toxin n=1 Tax=Pediococcus argentinicus TaxID=480391 RepID=UPI00338FF8C6